jgi:hypothetical protein
MEGFDFYLICELRVDYLLYNGARCEFLVKDALRPKEF